MQKDLAYMVTPVGPGDALGLAQVHVRAWQETYPGLLPQSFLDRMSASAHAARWVWRLLQAREITLAGEGPDGLVGYGSGEAFSRGGAVGEAEITTLYVLRQAQGQGLGGRLLTGLARTLAARGATSLVVWALRDNLPARGFYEAMGGVLAGERLERVGGWSVPSVAYRWGEIAVLV